MSKASEYVAAEWMRRYDEMKAQRDQLREALEEAVTWDSHDSEGVDAVWLEQARAAMAATEEGK